MVTPLETAALVIALAQLPAAPMATLKRLVTDADRGDQAAAFTLQTAYRLAVDNPQTPPATAPGHAQQLEAHFAERLAQLEAADRERLAGRQ